MSRPPTLPQRPHRRRMAAPGTPAAAAPTRRTPHQVSPPGNRQRCPHTLRTGAAWRLLPHHFPPYRIVFHYYRTWRQQLRQSEGRHPEPSAAIIDSQSVKLPQKGAARLRCRQKSAGTQAPYCGRYGGAAAGGSSASGGCARPRRRPAGIGGTGGQDVSAAADLG